MATPRKKHFRVGDSILREPWPREHKLALVLLQAHLNTRWRRDGIPNDEAGRCYLSQGAVFDVTGRKRIRSGFALLSKLSLSVSFTVELRGSYVFVDWPKFVEFQSFDTRTEGSKQARDEPPTKPVPSPSPSPQELSTPSPPPAPTKSPKGRKGKDPPPDWCLHEAGHLASKLRGKLENPIIPKSLVGWAREIEKIGAGPDATLAAIDWLYSSANEGKFRIVVQSGKTLRDKWNRIGEQMERTKPVAAPKRQCLEAPKPVEVPEKLTPEQQEAVQRASDELRDTLGTVVRRSTWPEGQA